MDDDTKHPSYKVKDFTNQRAYRNQPLSEQDTRIHRTQNQARAKVEHSFLRLKRTWGHAQGGLSGLTQERQPGVCDAGLDLYGAMAFCTSRSSNR